MKTLSLSLIALPFVVGCAATPPAPAVDTSTLPAEVRVPPGNKAALQLKAVGEVTWVCEFKGAPTLGQYEWKIQRPDARLLDRDGKQVGRYFGVPPQWDYWAGSNVTGEPVATAPSGPGNLPVALVKANPATGSAGVFTGTTYIQRVATKGGVAPAEECGWMIHRQTRNVKYEADYIFYRAG